MGWSSGSAVFDAVCKVVLDKKKIKPEEVIRGLIETLEAHDWDTHGESEYFDHPIVQKIFKELNPDWFEEE